jgi:aspartyl-tRNA(Asn)/glutamyl-tRNA(Gln) amidotransferase subunit A
MSISPPPSSSPSLSLLDEEKNTPWHELGLSQLSQLLQTQQITAVALAHYFLSRIHRRQDLGAFLAQDEAVTLAQAEQADLQLAQGDKRPLLGIPIAHKDVFVTRDFPTTAGSKMLAGYRSPFDATVVQRLMQAGMVTLGKLSCDEFAMGSSNENCAYGPVYNPWDTHYVPGGSSGGSAAAVAAGLTPMATGTDTGGSIRQPAAFCGITGIKPTYGRASRYGLVAYASSLDQAGVMARSAHDCALGLQACCGPDVQRDATSVNRPVEDWVGALSTWIDESGKVDLKGLRIGLPQEFFETQGLADDVRQAVTQAVDILVQRGARCVPVTLPRLTLAIPVYYLLACAEASSNLSRFDGVKFGYRCSNYTDLTEMYNKTRTEGFGLEVQRRLLIGTYVLSHGYYDAYYLKAQKIRRLLAQDWQQVFTQCDVVAGPVAPTPAWRLGEKIQDPLASYLADIYTLPASLAGLPAMSVPCGVSTGMGTGMKGEGNESVCLPIGLQLIGPAWQEGHLLALAHAFQQVTDWHQKRPPETA